MFGIDQVEKVMPDATRILFEERMRFEDIYATIEKYAAEYASGEEALMLGGTFGVNLLLDRERSLDDFTYEFYSEAALQHAFNMSNRIADVTELVWMRTLIANQLYTITVDDRPLVTIRALRRTPGTSHRLIQPIVKELPSGAKVSVLPPEIQLIRIYQILYSPNSADKWEEALLNENRLFQHLSERLPIKGSEPEGGEIHGSDEFTQAMRQKIRTAILSEFIINNPDVALIADQAFAYLRGLLSETPVIQIITTIPAEDIFQTVKKIIEREAGKIQVSKFERHLYVLDDMRIQRTVIKAGPNNKEVLYIHNSAQYELIPTNTLVFQNGQFLRVGNPFVLFRFILIELWILRWLAAGDHIDAKFLELRVNSLLRGLIVLRKQMSTGREHIATISDHFIDEDSNWAIFQSEPLAYIGVYEPEVIATKLKGKESQRHPDYLPAQWKRTNGEYRDGKNLRRPG